MSDQRNSSTPTEGSSPMPPLSALSAIKPAKLRRFPVASRQGALAGFSPPLARRPRWAPQNLPVIATMTPDRPAFRKVKAELPVLTEEAPKSPADLDGIRFAAEDPEVLRLWKVNEHIEGTLCQALQREKELEVKLTKLDASVKARVNTWQRDRSKLETIIETLRREKAGLDAKLQASERDREHLKSYISHLPASSEFEKLQFDQKVKTLEAERLMHSLQSVKVAHQKLSAYCDILTSDLAATRAQNEDLASQLAKEKSRSEEQERTRLEASSAATDDDISAILTENSALKMQHSALNNLVTSLEAVNLKLKATVKATSEDLSKCSSENEKFRSDLADADRRVEFLREQVTSRIVERDEERHTSAQLRQELFHARSSNDEVTAVSKHQFKLAILLTRVVESLKTLLEADSQIRKGQQPDTSKLLGSLVDVDFGAVDPENFVGRSDDLSRLEKDAQQLLGMIDSLRYHLLNACAEMVANGIVC